jgi:1,2-phenylacetyl-CoA epoxidase catalytic subunit
VSIGVNQSTCVQRQIADVTFNRPSSSYFSQPAFSGIPGTTARAGWRIAPSVGGPAGVAGFADEIGRSWLVDAADEPALHALQSLAYVYSREAANEKARELGWIV